MAKVVKKSNLTVVVRKYTDNNGQEKSIWKTIGELTTFQKDDGSYSTIAELYTMPGVTISVFEQKQNDNRQAPQSKQSASAQAMNQGMQNYSEEEIKIDNIPF